jgi:type IV pilus assembly protein PilE
MKMKPRPSHTLQTHQHPQRQPSPVRTQPQTLACHARRTHFPVNLAGLSLMETLLVLAMLAVIMAWAVPQYQDHLRRGQRQLAKLSLMQTAQWLERAAATQGTYPNPSQVPPALLQVPSGAYQIQLQTDAAANTFALQAVPQASQTSDACGMLTLNHLGEQGVQYARLSAQACWGR